MEDDLKYLSFPEGRARCTMRWQYRVPRSGGFTTEALLCSRKTSFPLIYVSIGRNSIRVKCWCLSAFPSLLHQWEWGKDLDMDWSAPLYLLLLIPHTFLFFIFLDFFWDSVSLCIPG
jgi:hypothetical protein